MFTGLIEALATVEKVTSLTEGLEVVFSLPNSWSSSLQLGESIAFNGVCSTLTLIQGNRVTIQYLKETLLKSTFATLKVGQKLNVERSLTPATRLGGHWVTGHVDGTGIVTQFKRDEPWSVLQIQYPSQFYPYILPKGSVTVDGIALTLVETSSSEFTCHLIPHTCEHTHLAFLKVGDKVNLEYDIVGKYLYHFHTSVQNGASDAK